MPGKWTPEHRAAYDETMRQRREARARGEAWVKPKRPTRVAPIHHVTTVHDGRDLARQFNEAMERVTAALVADTTETQRALRALAADVGLEMQGLRSTALRIENHQLAPVAAPEPAAVDPRLLAAVRSMNARLSALEQAVAGRDAWEAEVLTLLRRMDSRPPRIIEYRADHRRVADGGTPVRLQRKVVGLPKRRRDGRVP